MTVECRRSSRATGQIRVLLFELLALMADAAANVDVEGSAPVLRIPPSYLTLDGIYRQPRCLGLPAESHVVIELGEMFGIIPKPFESVLRRVKGVLKGCVHPVLGVFVACPLEMVRQRVVLRPDSIETLEVFC